MSTISIRLAGGSTIAPTVAQSAAPRAQPAQANPGAAIVTLPNAISLARLIAVPVVVWLVLHGHMILAFWCFAAAGLSDAADGWLARHGRASHLGAVLDPLADKLLLISTFIALAHEALLPVWLATLVVVRDLAIIGGVARIALRGERVVIAPLRISKLNTVLQIGAVVATLACAGFGWRRGAAFDVLILGAACTTILSGVLYLRQETRAARDA